MAAMFTRAPAATCRAAAVVLANMGCSRSSNMLARSTVPSTFCKPPARDCCRWYGSDLVRISNGFRIELIAFAACMAKSKHE